MLHKIHHGRALDAGAGYVVNGFGGNGHSYEHVGFPVLPGGTAECASCHGADNTAWIAPAARVHPNATDETRVWRAACGSCHDSSAAQSHIDSSTAQFGTEQCVDCHGVDRPYYVVPMHLVR
jgi:predicted CXXCH cytochrome family protein